MVDLAGSWRHTHIITEVFWFVLYSPPFLPYKLEGDDCCVLFFFATNSHCWLAHFVDHHTLSSDAHYATSYFYLTKKSILCPEVHAVLKIPLPSEQEP